MADYKIDLIPAFTDNYIFVLRDLINDITICIDPGEASKVIDYLEHNKLKLDYILNTHHHYDHITGNKDLRNKYNCKIIASKKDSHRILGITQTVNEEDEIKIGIFNFKILFTPGNTKNHISYYDEAKKLLFCGDTIFSSGCAKILEGTYDMLFESINKLAALDPDTLVFCAHEYTINNSEFALIYEPSNQKLKDKLLQAQNLRNNNQPTIPTTIRAELETNPFLRLHNKEIRKNLGFNSDHLNIKVFTKLRQLKDNF